jgi:hypothetical protein
VLLRLCQVCALTAVLLVCGLGGHCGGVGDGSKEGNRCTGLWSCDPGLYCTPIRDGQEYACAKCICTVPFHDEAQCWEPNPFYKDRPAWCARDAGATDARPEAAMGDVAKPKGDVAKLDMARLDAPTLDSVKPDSAVTIGCASPSGMQVFSGGMAGCPGTVTWANRATLCASGAHVCSATEWTAKRGTAAPAFSYWTSDDLKYNSGTFVGCYASLTSGTACTAGRPMRVCTGASDQKGNTCQYTDCGYNAPTPNQYFGGCNNDPTAGALCCK